MGERHADTDRYVGEFRYVFYAPHDTYQATVDFYREVLGFPIVGGFSYGTYFEASTGIIEIIDDSGSESLRDLLLQPDESYRPFRGGFLLIEAEDLTALQHRIERSGTPLLQQPRDWAWRFRDLKVEDPCGNVLCFFIRLHGWEEHHT